MSHMHSWVMALARALKCSRAAKEAIVMLSHSGQNRNRGSDNFYKVSIDTSVVQNDLFHGDGIEIWVSKPEMAFGPKCALIRKKPFGGCILLNTWRWWLLTTTCRQIPTWILWDNQEHLWIGIASHSVFCIHANFSRHGIEDAFIQHLLEKNPWNYGITSIES